MLNAKLAKSRYVSSNLPTLQLEHHAHVSQCDEEKPKCRACNRRNRPCTYANDGLNQLASAASAASSPFNRSTGSYFTPIQQFSGTISSANSQKHGDPSRYNQQHQGDILIQNQQHRRSTPDQAYPVRANDLPSTPNPVASDLNMDHLELMHHFSAVTTRELSKGPSTFEVWNTTVPQIALSHEFVMHGILATSALHLAHLRPEKRQAYWKRAATHQNRAIQLLQIAMAHPTRDNADALFAFSLIIFYLASATPSTADDLMDEIPLGPAIHTIHMLRGVRLILEAVRHWVEQGPLAQVLRWYPGHIQSNPTFRDPGTEEHFSKLLVFCSTTPNLNKDTEMEDVEIYAAAASSLRASFLKVESVPEGDPNTPPIWHWAVRLPATFVERLKEQHCVPLVLLAHWCVILLQARNYWWVGSWVNRTMGEIEACINQEYRGWLAWPIKKIKEVREILRGLENQEQF